MFRSPPTHALEAAYRAAHYQVDDRAPFVLRVGEPSAALAAWQRGRGVAASAFITAHNPGSRPRSAEDNALAHAALAAALLAGGWRAVPCRGVDPTGRWPDEAGFLVAGIAREAAIAIGRRFGQHGILWAGEDALAHLLILA